MGTSNGPAGDQTSPIALTQLLLMALAVLSAQNAFPQDADEKPKNKINLGFTHTLVPTAVNDSNEKYWLALPSWGLDYDRYLGQSWRVGMHTDLVIQNFEFEDNEGIIKKRVKPLSVVGVVTRELGKGFSVFAGGGIELSSDEETLALLRIGVEYGWELPRDFEISVNAMTDIKINAYNAFVFGFGIGKNF